MKALLLSLIILASLSLSAKNFQIIQTRGIVKFCKQATILKQGDKISSIEGICLLNKGDTIAAAALVDLDNGERFLLKAGKAGGGPQNNKLVAMRVSTDGGNRVEFQVNNIEDEILFLKNEFGSGKRIILSYKNSIKLKYAATNRISSFTAHYKYKGKWVKKYLPIKNRTLFFDKVHIFTVDGVSVNPQKVSEVQIYYNDYKIYAKPVLIAKFQAHFLPTREIMREFDIILSTPGNRPTTANKLRIVRRLNSYLRNFYGDISFLGNYYWVKKYVAKKISTGSSGASRKELMEKRRKEYLKEQKKKAKEKGGI